MDLAQFLKSQGASDEDVKALTEGSFSGVAKRAFEAAFSQAEADRNRAVAAEAAAQAEKTKADGWKDWYENNAAPEYAKMQTETVAAKANEARAVTALRVAQERGLLDVAKDLGYEVDPAKAAAAAGATPSGFDPTKYVTVERVTELARQEGRGIATMTTIASRHARLFPNDEPPNWTALYDEFVQSGAKQPFEQFWMNKFNVGAVQDARAKVDREAMEARLRKEGADAERQKMVDEGFNPGLRAPLPSTNVFVPRKAADGSTRQPWDVPENQARQERLKRAMENEAKAVTH